jgi:hypothetical protein
MKHSKYYLLFFIKTLKLLIKQRRLEPLFKFKTGKSFYS